MSHYNKYSFRTSNEDIKKRSSIQMKENILNYLTKTINRNKIKKLASLNDKKTEVIKDKKNENFYKELEKKTKAKKTLLYLLNIKSKGTFCPEIVDVFNKIKKAKKNEELLNEQEENNTNDKKNSSDINNNDNNKKIKTKSKFYPYKTAINNDSIKKNETNEIKENINDNKNMIKLNNELDIDKKSIDYIIDNKEIEIVGNEDIELDYNLKINELHINKNFVEEIPPNNIDNNNDNKITIKNKKRKKSNNKDVKMDTIDVIYNKQKNELQKSGYYHSSLRTAIQSTLGKKKLIHKKK